MERIKSIIGILFIIFTTTTYSQTSDLFRVEYTYFPQSDSDNTFRRFRAFINVPVKIGEDSYLVPGFEYRNINMKLRDEFSFVTDDKERLQSLNPSLGYTWKMKNDWRYAVKAGIIITSNFSGKLTSDDYVFEGEAFIIKDKTDLELTDQTKPWRLILGINYSTISGRPYPLPIINYFRRFHPDWTFTLGAPKSNLKYHFNKKSVLQGFITLDGFYANIQEDINLTDGGIGSTISMTTLLSGLGYEYYFTDHLLLYLYAGHTIINDIRMRDDNGDDVLTINDTNSFYGRTGIRFKF